MKSFLGAVLALAAIGAAAQSTNFNQIQHIETALNHLTVIDLAEPIVTVAVADPDSIQIERHDDKVFIKPVKEDVSTNLFIWTASRQIAYEIDPAGDLSKMNVIVRNAPVPAQHKPDHAERMSEPSDQEIQKIASLVLTQALMGTESIVREKSKDDAILSRFGWEIELQLPGVEDRRQILSQEVKALGLSVDAPQEAAALTQGMSG
ncbi:MAG TPA: TrbG/VirB9 family P-type conjugative transfer protein, partial [Terracidiphilus sp.]